MMNVEQDSANEIRSTAISVGFYTAILTAAVTFISFALAMTAIPISGSNCPGDCVDYPYLDTVAQFPRDYRWMLPAIALLLLYVILVIAIHGVAPASKRIFGQIGLAFALMSATILATAYYTQFFIVPVSLMNGETEGIALLTQYNPHGLFIALEEFGYLLMGLSFLFIALALTGSSRLERTVRWIFLAGFALTAAALVVVMSIYGLERLDRFEVAAITIDWIVLLVNGVLLSLVFRSKMAAQPPNK